jgi:hypothetical protein
MEQVDATIIDLDWPGYGIAHDERLAVMFSPDHFGWAIERLRTLAIYAGGLHSGHLMLREYQIKGSRYAMPLHFTAETGDCFPRSVQLASREQAADGAGRLESLLSARFGFNLDWRDLDQVHDKAGLASSILARPFAVRTRVTSRPPHRSVRAQFGHTAPTSDV